MQEKPDPSPREQALAMLMLAGLATGVLPLFVCLAAAYYAWINQNGDN